MSVICNAIAHYSTVFYRDSGQLIFDILLVIILFESLVRTLGAVSARLWSKDLNVQIILNVRSIVRYLHCYCTFSRHYCFAYLITIFSGTRFIHLPCLRQGPWLRQGHEAAPQGRLRGQGPSFSLFSPIRPPSPAH